MTEMSQTRRDISPQQEADLTDVKDAAEAFRKVVKKMKASRAMSIALTKVDEAALWASAGIVNDE